MNKFYFLPLLLLMISCGADNNIFNNGKKSNSDRIGDILPGEAALELLVNSPENESKQGSDVLVSGACGGADEVVISSESIIQSITAPCVQGTFEESVTLNSSTAQNIDIAISIARGKNTLSEKRTVMFFTEVPTLPSHIDIVKANSSSVILNWNLSSSVELPLKGYILEYKKAGDSSWVKASNKPIEKTEFKVESLEPSTDYEFRVKASNGNSSSYSVVKATTTPENDFFKEGIKAINIAGATSSSLVAIEAGDFYLNGSLLTSLNAGETHQFSSSQFDILSSQSAFYIAGLKSFGGGSNRKGNLVWTTQDWSSKTFSFSASRAARHILNVVAFEDAQVSVFQGDTKIDEKVILANSGDTFKLPNNANYRIESSGIISAYLYSATNGENQIQDPRPLLPNSTDLIGFPSRQGFASADIVGTEVSGIFSNDSTINHSFLDLSKLFKFDAVGTRDRYKSEVVRLFSTNPIEAISNADYDGYGSAPFLPRAKFKNTYGLNVDTQWLAMASISEGTIEITKPNGDITTHALLRSGTSPNAPFKVRVENLPAGSLIRSSVPTAAWYEPKTDNYGANDDETLLFGYNR